MQQQEEPQLGEVQQPPRATATTGRTQMMQQQRRRPQECGVCFFVYEEQERRPRTLPCGHTFCSLCVAVLLQAGCLTCPSCCTDHLAPSVDHFPISYTVEALVRELQAAFLAMGGTPAAAGEASLPTPRDSQATKVKRKQKAVAGLSRKLQSMIQEQQTSLGNMAVTLQQELEQLNQYRAQLALSQAKHGCLLEELDKLAQQHRGAIELLREEDGRVEAFMEEGQEVQREVRAAQGQLQQVSTPQQAFSTIDAADHTTVEAEEWLQHSREEMPNSTVLRTSWKEVEATEATLEAARAVAGVMPHQDTPAPGHLHCTIMEAVDIFKEGPLKLEDLERERPRKRLEAGQVFAVMRHEDGTCYSSKMTCDGNKTLLHSLKPGSPPAGASTLQVSKAVEDLDYGSISVFLDLSWPGTSSHRVNIRLEANTPLTRWFMTLCLGHTGLTYHSTKFLDVRCSGDLCSILWLQETGDQRAAKSHQLPPLQANECGDHVHPSVGMVVASSYYRHQRKHKVRSHRRRGRAWSPPSGTVESIQFGIVIDTAYGCDHSNLYCVGKAEVSVLEQAVNDNILKHIQVVDCGVVLPL